MGEIELHSEHPRWVKRCLRLGLILVVIGVVGEWRYGAKLEHTHNAIREYDVGKIVGAEKETAQLQKDAEQLKKDAEDEHLARVKIEDAVAWRTLTDDQRNELRVSLKRLPKRQAMVFHDQNDFEAGAFASEIAGALKEAKWDVFESFNANMFFAGIWPVGSMPPTRRGFTVVGSSDQVSQNGAQVLQNNISSFGFDLSKPLLAPPGSNTVFVSIDHRPEGPQGKAKLREEAAKKAKTKNSQNAK